MYSVMILPSNEREAYNMRTLKQYLPGLLAVFIIAVPSWLLGKRFPVIGGPVVAILIGMVLTLFWKQKNTAEAGIKWTSRYILQAAVVLLGFGMDLGVILQTGKQSFPIILCTISTSLLIAWLLHRWLHIPTNTATLIGVGSSICGGSAIAATAPVIDADDTEVAQAISVIFFFNVLAAIGFPLFGKALGFDTASGNAFGVFAGTAINDTSSVTAAASTWDSMWQLGNDTLNTAVTVKLTRTLAIIPITLVLSGLHARHTGSEKASGKAFSLRRAFPLFILYFILASVFTTVCIMLGADASLFSPLKELSKFLIVMAMAAIGLNSNLPKLIRSGGKPIFLGACCWIGIILVSLCMQHVMEIW